VVLEPKAKRKARQAEAAQARGFEAWLPRFFPLLAVLVLGGWALSKARLPSADTGEMDLYAAGELPVMYQGRAKPLDTLARQTMCVMSNRQTSRMAVPQDEVTLVMKMFGDGASKPEPAIKWFFDVVSNPGVHGKHWIIRIDNTDVLNTLGLEPRKGFRYSIAEIMPQYKEFRAQVLKAAKVHEENRSTYEKKLLEVDNRIGAYITIIRSFWPHLPDLPTEEEFKTDQQGAIQTFAEIRGVLGEGRLPAIHDELNAMNPPRAVPDPNSNFGWTPYSMAKDLENLAEIRSIEQGGGLRSKERSEALVHWGAIIDAYRSRNATQFNRAVNRYQTYLDQQGPDSLQASAPRWEAFFNNAEPFYYAAVLYLFAFVLSALAWLGWSRPFNRAAFWLLAFTFVYHTLALCLRMYISGRPPVTNLYSSAVFIGWGCVLFGLVFERIYRMGLGNTVAAIAGSSTLVIAHLLMTQVPSQHGDTMAVLQAVLDTQFWLATHVVCVTLGYAATFMAGLFGLVFVIRGVFTHALTPELAKNLSRMTYGTICFAMLFSFFGTVLGGLWADDSWGRFWGWDPKENGALIIVLWNALVLHARWGGMVKDRGLAVLAIGGNIVTAWSWFGVNELRVGLHSYGFTEGALFVLGIFMLSQMIAIGLGSIPKRNWLSAANVNAAS
jgi:ABC-type transport system involved in cytochrome c biogenesis permease subunit